MQHASWVTAGRVNRMFLQVGTVARLVLKTADAAESAGEPTVRVRISIGDMEPGMPLRTPERVRTMRSRPPRRMG